MSEHEIKNTAPAVMTDKGPYDTPRAKSADGRYTAGGKGYNLEKQADDAPGTDKKWLATNRPNAFEAALDENIYTPLFTRLIEKFFMPMHIMVNKNNPNHVPFIMRTNQYYDKKLGIDFVFGSKNAEGFVNQPLIKTDLKVIDTFGKPDEYKSPSVTLNLFKRNGDNENWENGSFLNKHHLNNFYTYICPQSSVSKKDMLKTFKNESFIINPHISEAKMIHIQKKTLDTYFQDKIMSSQGYQEALEVLQDKDAENKASIDFPVPGETFRVTMFLIVDKNGNRSIRMSLPYEAFEKKRIKADIVKTVPFDKLNTNKYLT